METLTTPVEKLGGRFWRFNFAHAADVYLERFNGSSISDQLRERRISKVKILPTLFPSGIGTGEDGNFFIALNDILLPQEWARGIGHEIGHTFHFNLTYTPPVDYMPGNLHKDVEDFCEAFADQWVRQNSEDVVVDWVAKNF